MICAVYLLLQTSIPLFLDVQVLTYLRSPNWDTRIAAGQAVEAIVKNIPEWNPPPRPKEGKTNGDPAGLSSCKFGQENDLAIGSPLLALLWDNRFHMQLEPLAWWCSLGIIICLSVKRVLFNSKLKVTHSKGYIVLLGFHIFHKVTQKYKACPTNNLAHSMMCLYKDS